MANTRTQRTTAEIAADWAERARKARERLAETLNPDIKRLRRLAQELDDLDTVYHDEGLAVASHQCDALVDILIAKALESDKPKERQLEIE